MFACIVDVVEGNTVASAFKLYCCNVCALYWDLSPVVLGDRLVDKDDRSGSRRGSVVGGWVNDGPVLVGSCLVEEVDVGFLEENKVSIFGIGAVEKIKLCYKGFVEILLSEPNVGDVVGAVCHD